KVGEKIIYCPRHSWARIQKAFQPIISEELFMKAQKTIATRQQRISNEELLKRLQKLQKSKKNLTAAIIDKVKNFPKSHVYILRFGSLRRAYDLIGYTPKKDYRFFKI